MRCPVLTEAVLLSGVQPLMDAVIDLLPAPSDRYRPTRALCDVRYWHSAPARAKSTYERAMQCPCIRPPVEATAPNGNVFLRKFND
eukprot:1528838-Rhodomonas_salina.1